MDHVKRLVVRLVRRREEDSPAAEIKREKGSPATEIISAAGELNEKGLEDFMKLHECGVSYAVVTIMGPQSSGKSTLLNHLFHTNFSEMDASIGRGKTTNGIWIAKAVEMEPCIMVMDVEGTDGQERGQDGTTFEKRSTLFALVVSDIFFINMWCSDIGRENAANRPLLKTIFEVMMQISVTRSHKATLHFIIHDKINETPIEILKNQLRTDIIKIWEIVPKTKDFKDSSLSTFFNVEVDALSHYKHERKQFNDEVIQLRKRVLSCISVAGDRGVVIPTSGLSLHMKKLWETIKENKELDLPTHKEMVATVRCEEIANEKLKLFKSDKEWLKLEAEAKEGLVPGFGAKLELIWSTRYLTAYDSESKYYEEGVRNARRQYMESKVFDVVCPAYRSTLDHLRVELSTKFESGLEQALSKGGGYAVSVAACRQSCEDEFDKRCLDAAANAIKKKAEWDASFVRKELVGNIKNHALVVRTDKLPQVEEKCRARLRTKITKHLNKLFKLRDEEGFTWANIRSFVKRESDSAASALRSDIAAFKLDDAAVEHKVHDIKEYGRDLVVKKFKEETDDVLNLMKARFTLSNARKEEPHRKCVKLLSKMAVIRLDESPIEGEVERLLFSAFIYGDEAVSLDSHKWEEVSPDMTLITPAGCKDIWEQFQLDIDTAIKQIQIAERHGNSKTSDNSETPPELSDNSETPESKLETSDSKLPFWVRLGTWLLGAAEFAMIILWRHHELALAIPLFSYLAREGAELYEDYADWVKRGCKKMKRTYWQTMKKFEEALEKFYNFMKGIFTKKSKVEVSS